MSEAAHPGDMNEAEHLGGVSAAAHPGGVTATEAGPTRSRARSRRLRTVLGGAAGALGLAVALGACSGTGITPSPLQASVASTFARLYVYQQAEQGDPAPSLAALHTTATCQKGLPSTPQEGSGSNWSCDVVYLVAGPATPVTARYTVDVQTDGCYAADGDGPQSVNGFPTITGAGQQQVINPLWAFDGCFDIT